MLVADAGEAAEGFCCNRRSSVIFHPCRVSYATVDIFQKFFSEITTDCQHQVVLVAFPSKKLPMVAVMIGRLLAQHAKCNVRQNRVKLCRLADAGFSCLWHAHAENVTSQGQLGSAIAPATKTHVCNLSDSHTLLVMLFLVIALFAMTKVHAAEGM